MLKKQEAEYTATTNPCKVCSPLGVSLAVKGIEGGMSILHGSQGCATYIRRYLISHFREPVDIASSSFDEMSAIFGGQENLRAAIRNISTQYNPKLIAVSSTCLADTIGDDVTAWTGQFADETDALLVPVNAKTFDGAYLDGFYAAVSSIVKNLSGIAEARQVLNIFPSLYSTEDIRLIDRMCSDFGIDAMIMPDFSETLDGGIWGEYLPISPGGTKLKQIKASTRAEASISFSPFLSAEISAADFLENEFSVEHERLRPPFGIHGTDSFISMLEKYSSGRAPAEYGKERSRLIDAYADCHKYLYGKRAAVYGDADFCAGMASFLDELGVIPEICACGSPFTDFELYVNSLIENSKPGFIGADIDFNELEQLVRGNRIDFMIGSSKGYKISRKLGIPLVRCGFPVHDRAGGPRIRHIGFQGAFNLLDLIVNTLLEKKQDDSKVGYSYL